MRRSPSKPAPRVKPAIIDRALLARWPLPDPPVNGDKEGRGRVLIIGGARQMPGAVILAATAALRVGAGKLQIATVAGVATGVAIAIPEAFVHQLPEATDGGFRASARRPLDEICLAARSILIGPGTIENAALAPLVLGMLSRLGPDHTVVLDAGALTVLARHHGRVRALTCTLVVTPHAGEMAKLLGRDKETIVSEPVQSVTDAARGLRAIAILKGAETLVSDGETIYANRAGNVGLATSGSGDTLSGLIAGLVARGTPAFQAAVWGVHLHACAGDVLARKVGPLGYLPRELLGEIPALMARGGAVRRPRHRTL